MGQSRAAEGIADITGRVAAVGVEDRPGSGWLSRAAEWARVEARDHLPIWFLYLQAIGLLHALLANYPEEGFARLGIPRTAFVPTLAFSLSWFALYFVLRIRRSVAPAARPWRYAGLTALVLGVPLLVTVGHSPYPLTHDQLTFVYEGSQLLWVALFMGQMVWKRGRGALAIFFGATFVYGLVLENAGIVMRFFYEPSFHLYLGPLPAPLCTMLGWCVVFYTVFAVTEQLAAWLPGLLRAPWARALTATAMALSLDAQLDPLASMSGVFWRWNEALPPAFYGVPAVNFAAWLGAMLPFSYFLFALSARRDLTDRARAWELFLRAPLSALLGGLVCFGVMALVEGGFDGPSFEILRRFGALLLPY